VARKRLKLTDIITDAGTQARVGLDGDAVADYGERLKAGVDLPPVKAVTDGASYWLWDGHHTCAAARKAGRQTVLCEVTEGTLEDARWLACSANQAHGLKRTNADKRRAVELALGMRPELSNRAIADHCGVSDPFVAEVRRQVLTVSTCDTRTGLDGKQYPPTQPPPGEGVTADATAEDGTGDVPSEDEGDDGQTYTPPDADAAEEEDDAGHWPDEVPPAPHANGRPAPPPAPPVRVTRPGEADKRGNPLRPHLRDVFADEWLAALRAQVQMQFDAATEQLNVRVAKSPLARAVAKAKANPYAQLPEIIRKCEALADLLADLLELTDHPEPYAVCPRCEGHGCKPAHDGCRDGCGWVPRWRFDEITTGAA
jgi:hypothetical protein